MYLKERVNEGDLVLLFDSRLRLFPEKLRSRWSDPFEVTNVFQNGAIEIKGKFNEAFIMNRHRLKHYHCVDNRDYYTSLKLGEPPTLSTS